ncbi:MAG: hypothetical protein WC915_03215 [archaeon]|jgi:hypothetical protein
MQIEKFKHLRDLNEFNKIYTEIDFDIQNKQIIDFCIIQFHIENKRKIQIIRIGTAHGKPHIHKFYSQNNSVEKFDEKISTQAYEKAKQFIYSNWKTFLETYKKKDLK